MMNRVVDAFVLGFGLALSALILFMYIAGCGAPDRPAPLGNIAPDKPAESPPARTATSTSALTGDNGQNGMLVAYGGLPDGNGQNYCYCMPGGNYAEGAAVDVEPCAESQANLSVCSSWTLVGFRTPGFTMPQYIQSNMITGQWYLDAHWVTRPFGHGYFKLVVSHSPQNPLWVIDHGRIENYDAGYFLWAGRDTPGASSAVALTGTLKNTIGSLVKGNRLQEAIRFDGWTDPANGHVMYVCPTGTVKGDPVVLCDGVGQDVNGVDDPPVTAQWINFTDTFFINNGPTIATLGTRYSIPGSDHTLFIEGLNGTINEADNYDAIYFTREVVGTTSMMATIVASGGSQWCLTAPNGAGAGYAVTPTRCGDGGLQTQQFSEVYEF